MVDQHCQRRSRFQRRPVCLVGVLHTCSKAACLLCFVESWVLSWTSALLPDDAQCCRIFHVYCWLEGRVPGGRGIHKLKQTS